MTIYGYARVSTDGQSLEAQHAALSAAGAEQVFAEKISGAVTDRRPLARCLRGLEAGDVLLVTKLDRLARSTRDLRYDGSCRRSWRGLQVARRSLGRHDHAPRQANDHGPRSLAKSEMHLILARTNEGRKRAKARGVRFGRKLKLTKHQQQEALARRAPGEALAEIGRSYNVSHSTISRLGRGAVRSLLFHSSLSGPVSTSGHALLSATENT